MIFNEGFMSIISGIANFQEKEGHGLWYILNHMNYRRKPERKNVGSSEGKADYILKDLSIKGRAFRPWDGKVTGSSPVGGSKRSCLKSLLSYM